MLISSDSSSLNVKRSLFSSGFARSYLTEHSKSRNAVACRCRSVYCLVCRKGRSSIHCCMCFTPPSWSRSSCATAYVYICMPMIAAHLLKMFLMQLASLQHVSWTIQRLSECIQTSVKRSDSSQLLDKVNCHEVLVLGTRATISDTTHDLGVVIDRELSLAAHVTVVCCSGHNQLLQLRPVVHPLVVHECHQDARPGVHLVSPGLLQLTAVWHQQRFISTPPVGAERCRSPGHSARRDDHITPVLWQLHGLPVFQQVTFKIR